MKKVISISLITMALQADCQFTFDMFAKETDRLSVELSLGKNANPYIIKNTAISVIRQGKYVLNECKGIAPQKILSDVKDSIKMADEVIEMMDKTKNNSIEKKVRAEKE